MKRLLMSIVGLLMLQVFSWAQGPSGPGRLTPEERKVRFEEMAEALQLTPEQREEILLLQQDTREQMRALRESGASREEMMMRLHELRQENEAWMEEILTEEQYVQYQQMRQERMEGSSRRPGRGGDR